MSAEPRSTIVQVLYLEDDVRDVEPVMLRLKQTGLAFELCVAKNRQEYERALTEKRFDLILSDYLLPSYDGMSALVLARKVQPEVPFMLISGVLGEEQAVDCVLHGATDYVLKHHLDRLVPATLRALHEAEEHRRRHEAEQALRESEERYRSIVQTANEGIWVLDAEQRTSLVNRRLEEMLGNPSSELMGRHPDEFVADSGPDCRIPLLNSKDCPTSCERTFLHKNGTEVFTIISTSALFNPEGVFVGAVMMLTDITERKRAEAEKTRLEGQLQQANNLESLGRLAGGIAHDMNNVLGAILGIASANLEITPADSSTFPAFETISKAATRGGKMVKSLLRFARQTPYEAGDINLNAILREEVKLLERTTLSKIRLEMDLASELNSMRGDESALTHALMNLCVNAVDAMPEGGFIQLKTRNINNDWVEVQVRDSGVGMHKEVLEKALDPFFTTKKPGKGTGLGLSMVYTTVKAHQGQMEIQSVPGQGTCVLIRFPTTGPSPEILENPATPQSEPPSKRLAILLVDDDEMVRNSTQSLLEVMGHIVTPVQSGEEALEKLEAGFKPDGVILDMNMPGLSGPNTLLRLRAIYPEMPVLLATGQADQHAMNLVSLHSRLILLPKPYGFGDLKQNIQLSFL